MMKLKMMTINNNEDAMTKIATFNDDDERR